MRKSYFTHTLHTMSLRLAPRLLSVENRESREGKKPLIAPIGAVTEDMCAGDSSGGSNNDNNKCDGNYDSHDDPSARISMAYLFYR